VNVLIPVIGLGAGGHAKVVIDILRNAGIYEPVGLLDSRAEMWGRSWCGVPVLGGDDLLRAGESPASHFFLGLGSTGAAPARVRLHQRAMAAGFQAASAIHPRAVVAGSAQLGGGPTIMAGAIINPDVRLGDNVIVNTGAIIEHDCRIGDHVHVAPGARLAGDVRVGSGAHIGIGATVLQGIRIGSASIVGAGAVVVRDVPDGVVVAGVPARVLRPRAPESL
jgi:UDP-perosamine 4-acetyltransferase